MALGALSFFVGACNDAEYSEIENGVYIAEASPMDNYVQQVELQMVDEANVEPYIYCSYAASCISAMYR